MLVDPGAVHVCYCHNPFRYAWSEREATLRARGPLLRPPLRLLLNRWRQWDWIAAQRVDRYVANSHLTATRVRRYLGREATVLHPPVASWASPDSPTTSMSPSDSRSSRMPRRAISWSSSRKTRIRASDPCSPLWSMSSR